MVNLIYLLCTRWIANSDAEKAGLPYLLLCYVYLGFIRAYNVNFFSTNFVVEVSIWPNNCCRHTSRLLFDDI